MAMSSPAGSRWRSRALAKEVTQLAEGEQSDDAPEARRATLFAIAEKGAGPATTASSLGDGLQKLARGELEPETWSVTLHRVPGNPPAGSTAKESLFAISGREATVRERNPDAGDYTRQQAIELEPDEIRTLARELGRARPGRLAGEPPRHRLHRLSISVLNRRQSVQARRFAGMAPTAHGEIQRTFAAAVELIAAVERGTQRAAPRNPKREPDPPTDRPASRLSWPEWLASCSRRFADRAEPRPRHLRTDSRPFPEGRIVEALLESAERGRPVRLPAFEAASGPSLEQEIRLRRSPNRRSWTSSSPIHRKRLRL